MDANIRTEDKSTPNLTSESSLEIISIYIKILYFIIYSWFPYLQRTANILTHWGRVTYICVNKLTIIGSDDGLSPGRRQAIIWTNGGILLIGPLGTDVSEISIKIHILWSKKTHLKVSSAKCRTFCLDFNVLNGCRDFAAFLSIGSVKNKTNHIKRAL